MASTPSEPDDFTYSIVERVQHVRLSPDLVQDLYEGPRKCQCCINWVEEAPANLDLSPIKEEDDDEQKGPPLIIRRKVLPGEGKTQADIHSIEIRNAAVRKILCDVFSGYDFITDQVKYLVFLAPFRQFFWRWDKFENAVGAAEDDAVKAILVQLRAIVKVELAEAFAG